MNNKREKDALRAYFKRSVEKFDESLNDPNQYHKLFTELCSNYVRAGCKGFCPECDQMLECETYQEIRGEWQWFAS